MSSEESIALKALPGSELATLFLAELAYDSTTLDAIEFFNVDRHGYAAFAPILDKKESERENNLDIAYKTINQVLSATKAIEYEQSDHASLFECYLDVHNKTVLQPRDELPVLWKNPNVGMSDVLVYVVRESAVDFRCNVPTSGHRQRPRAVSTRRRRRAAARRSSVRRHRGVTRGGS